MNPVRIQGDIATLNYQSTNRGVDTRTINTSKHVGALMRPLMSILFI